LAESRRAFTGQTNTDNLLKIGVKRGKGGGCAAHGGVKEGAYVDRGQPSVEVHKFEGGT